MMRRLFLLGGMRPDARVFDRLLPLVPAAEVIPWIAPRPHELLPDYAARLAETVQATANDCVCGVSFGGIIARELAPRLGVRKCIVISSIRTDRELPPRLRVLRPIAGPRFESLLKLGGAFPSRRMNRFAGSDGPWYRWATTAVLRWRASPDLERIPSLHIHGDRDRTFPLRYVRPDVVLPGGHTLAVKQAEELARRLIAEIAS